MIELELPTCGRCRINDKFREYTFLFVVFAFICLFIGLYGAAQYGEVRLAHILVSCFFWGIPVVGLILCALFTGTGITSVRQVRRSADRKYLIVPVHPTFAEEFAGVRESGGRL